MCSYQEYLLQKRRKNESFLNWYIFAWVAICLGFLWLCGYRKRLTVIANVAKHSKCSTMSVCSRWISSYAVHSRTTMIVSNEGKIVDCWLPLPWWFFDAIIVLKNLFKPNSTMRALPCLCCVEIGNYWTML